MTKVKDNNFHFRISTDDKNEIVRLAELAGLTPAEFTRRAALNIKINTRFDLVLANKLFKVAADMARLGNLLKLSLDRFYECNDKKTIAEINAILVAISDSQTKLKEKIIEL